MDSISIGLDIGSSAVRAAEIEVRQGRRTLRRYGQVGLPAGYVVDGEVVNELGVAEALRRLWAETGFSSNRVVLGVSGPRVFVRQADVPAMAPDDLRSSLRFNAQDMVPIALEDASFDFSVLAQPGPEAATDAKMTVLLVAAHQEVLRTYLGVLKMAGLTAVAMDSTALALIRAVPAGTSEGDSSGLDVLVSVGAELTTVAVRQGAVPKFIRSLTVGGSKLTASMADSMHLEMAVAERLKRGAVPADTPQLPQVRRVIASDIRDIAEDVRATVDFFMSQSDGYALDKMLITGGASQTSGLAAAIGGDMPAQIFKIDPFTGFETGPSGLGPDDLARASSTATTAIGLALWPFESPLIRLSVLPEEVFILRRNRRLAKLGAVAVAALAGVLGVAGATRYLQVHSEQNAARAAEHQAAVLSAQVAQLQSKTAAHGQMQSRGQMVQTALQGDLDYVRLLGQLASVMPANLHITSANITRPQASATSPAAGSGASPAGTLTVSVTGTGNAQAAADWLNNLKRDPDLSNLWLSGVTINKTGGTETVTFGSNANLTTTAQSNRSEAVKP